MPLQCRGPCSFIFLNVVKSSRVFLSAIFSKLRWMIFTRKHTEGFLLCGGRSLCSGISGGAKGRRPEDHWICRSRNWMGQRFCHISLRRLDCHEGRGWEGSVGIRMGCCSGVHWKRLKPILELGDRIGWPGWPGCCFASLWSALRLGCWSMD